MKGKLLDAIKDLRKEVHEEKNMWKEIRNILRSSHVLYGFNEVWENEKSFHFAQYRQKRKEKVSWLKIKFCMREKVIPDKYKGVNISDGILDEAFETKLECYGNVETSEDERNILKTHPSFTVFRNMSAIECEAEIEKALTKIRWSKANESRETEITPENARRAANVKCQGTFDMETDSFNFKNARATDLPFNSNTFIPKPLDETQEIQLENLKMNLLKISEEYFASNDNKLMNLSESQTRGLKSLEKRRDNNEIVLFRTDKSGKISIDTPDNYKESAKPHTMNDDVVSNDVFNSIEKEVNAHSIFWLKMLNVAKDSGDFNRYKSSMLTHNSEYSTQYMYRKDHKTYDDRVIGPPVRPLCDVSDSYAHKLSYFLCNILKEVYGNEESVCESTEDMLASIHEANASGKIDKRAVIGSLDVKSLYPSLDIDFTVEVACNEFYESKLTIEGVDYEELGLYLSLNRKAEYLKEIALIDNCPTRKSKYGPPPRITGSGVKIKKEGRFKFWNRPKRKPNCYEERRMIKEALRFVLLLIMKNHIYIFNGTLKKQREGGAIGIDLTGVLAQIFMSWWDKRMLEKLLINGIHVDLYKRYVDDINMCITATAPGCNFIEGVLVTESEVEGEDVLTPDDKRSFELVRMIGESIHKSIKLTVDVPSNHEDGKVPILDLKVWVTHIETTNGQKVMILHEHYTKEVSSKFVIHKNAALPIQMKRTILTQQCLRVLLNCNRTIGWEKICNHLSHFIKRMQLSGYDKELRYEVLKSAIHAYDKMREAEREQGVPLYRKKEWRRVERRKEKDEKKTKWYKKGGNQSVLFVTATPGSELKQRLQAEVRKTPFKVKLIEKSGTKLIKILQKNDPFKKGTCADHTNCMICMTSENGNCRTTGVTYEIACLGECGFKYTGQTGNNGYTRAKKHSDDYKSGAEQSALRKHCVNIHNKRKQNFEMRVVDRCRNDPTKRQILEAIRIRRNDPAKSMNERNEWNKTLLPQIHVTN